MNTSSDKFYRLMHEFPSEQHAIARLESILFPDNNPEEREFTIERLYEVTEPSSLAAMAALLVSLVNAHLIEKIIRIESEGSGGGIQDFKSLLEVPESIHDWRTDREINITLDNIRVIYRTNTQHLK